MQVQKHIEEIESTVLGTVLAYPLTWTTVQRTVTPEMFRGLAGREVAPKLWRFFVESGAERFSLSLFAAKELVSPDLLQRLVVRCDIQSIDLAADLLAAHYRNDCFWDLIDELARDKDKFKDWQAANGVFEDRRKVLFAEASTDTTLAQDFADFMEGLKAGMKGDLRNAGITTGFKHFDAETGGWWPGDQVILGARPGMGKTRYALLNAIKAAQDGKHVAFFSKELTKRQILATAASYFSGLPVKHFRNFDLDDADFDHVLKAASPLKDLNIKIYDRIPDANYVIAKAREQKFSSGLDIFFVDYVQQFRKGGDGNRAEELDEIAYGFKDLAKDIDAVSFLLSQLSRAVDARVDKRPKDSDLRESGGLEASADSILFLYNPAKYFPDSTEPFEVIFSKNRFGVPMIYKMELSENGFLLTQEEKEAERLWWENLSKQAKTEAPAQAPPRIESQVKPAKIDDDDDIPF